MADARCSSAVRAVHYAGPELVVPVFEQDVGYSMFEVWGLNFWLLISQVFTTENTEETEATTVPQNLQPTRPPLQQNASTQRGDYNFLEFLGGNSRTNDQETSAVSPVL